MEYRDRDKRGRGKRAREGGKHNSYLKENDDKMRKRMMIE